METNVLKYTSDLDDLVYKAVNGDLNEEVVSVERIIGGEFNYVYKVCTKKGMFIVRVFRQRNSPDDGKLEWIEEQLTYHQVPHAKTLWYTRDTTYFPFGYMTQEFLEGKSGFDAIMDGDISFEEFFNQEAVLLQKIHSISSRGFGEIKEGKGEFDSYFEAKLAKYKEMNGLLKSHDDIEEDVHKQVLDIVQKLERFDQQGWFKPVLLHGDPPPGNTIINQDLGVVLIDWDNAISGSWIDEYTGLATRGAFMWRHKLSEEERNKIITRAFKNNYKGVDFDDLQLIEIVSILEVLNAYGGLVTHYYQHEDMELYETAKKRLDGLLHNF